MLGGLDPKRYGNFLSTLQVTPTTTIHDLEQRVLQFEATELLSSDTRAHSKALVATDYDTVDKDTAKLVKNLVKNQLKQQMQKNKSAVDKPDTRKCFNCNTVGHIAVKVNRAAVKVNRETKCK